MNLKFSITCAVLVTLLSSCTLAKKDPLTETPSEALPAATLTIAPVSPAASTALSAQFTPSPADPTASAAASPPAAASAPGFREIQGTMAARIERIQQQVSALRGLPILSRPRSYLVNDRNIAQLFRLEVSTHQPPAEFERQLLTYQALGLIPANAKLEDHLRNIAIGGIAGLYRAESDEVYVVGNALGKPERFTYAHEFSHALVDQRFDLTALERNAGCPVEADRCLALRALIEGEASLTAEQWAAQSGISPPNGPGAPGGARSDLPLFTLPLLEFPYSYGKAFAQSLYARGGWEAVNAALANPPASSEQILHPDKYLAGELPVALPDPDLQTVLGGDWSVISDGGMGEWMTFLVLAYSVDANRRLPVEMAQRAAQGWGGDRAVALQASSAGQTTLAAHWGWDTPADAAEFKQALQMFLKLKPGETCREAAGRVDCVVAYGVESFWISAPEREMVERLAAAAGATH